MNLTGFINKTEWSEFSSNRKSISKNDLYGPNEVPEI